MAHGINIPKLYGAPSWVDFKFIDDVGMDRDSSGGVYSVANLADAAFRLCTVSNPPTRIFEFGSGLGHGLVALDMLARTFIKPPEVIGSEISQRRMLTARALGAKCVTVAGIVPDGIAELRNCTDEKFDLVVAHMLGHFDTSRDFAEEFLVAATGAVVSGGIVAVCSDVRTMQTVRDVAHEMCLGKQRVTPPLLDIPIGSRNNPRLFIEI